MQTRLSKKVCELTSSESWIRARYWHSEIISFSPLQTYVCNCKQPFQEILPITYKAHHTLCDSLSPERIREKSFYYITQQKENKEFVKFVKVLLRWRLPVHSGFPMPFPSLYPLSSGFQTSPLLILILALSIRDF